jgi:hypothetical protein
MEQKVVSELLAGHDTGSDSFYRGLSDFES